MSFDRVRDNDDNRKAYCSIEGSGLSELQYRVVGHEWRKCWPKNTCPDDANWDHPVDQDRDVGASAGIKFDCEPKPTPTPAAQYFTPPICPKTGRR